ncbi:MAG: alpha/beta hydrolase [Thermoproteota archaeon]|nr:MAG: alpha/beta hydrolase [Candidatus Korarchaeota archaeon]RLG52323.1 MAG: alpha/beta hydrolase [Candidatus Korarchaeota archaeon]
MFMSTESWSFQSTVLSRRYRVILHDCRGQWRSSKPPGEYTFSSHVEDLRALLEHLEAERAHIIGTSYGGEIAMFFALKYPEMVRSLSIIASVSEIRRPLSLLTDRWIAAAETRDPVKFILGWINDVYSDRFLEEHWSMLWRRLTSVYRSFDFDAAVRLLRCFKTLEREPLTPKLGGIRAPTMVVAAELDRVKPPLYSRIISEGIPGSELHIVHGSGHAVIIERHEAVNTLLLGFLEKCRLQERR